MVSIAVTTQSLDKLQASGGVRVTLESGLGRTLAVEASGSVVVTAKRLELDTLKLDASGGTRLDLAGHVAEVQADLSGGVDLDASKLVAARIVLDAKGSCTVRLCAKESVTGSVSGGVAVEVHGHPHRALVRTSGRSQVEHLD